MLFKSTSAFKKQSVKPKKSGLENPLDSFLGRNSILDDKYEDTVSQKKYYSLFKWKGRFLFLPFIYKTFAERYGFQTVC